MTKEVSPEEASFRAKFIPEQEGGSGGWSWTSYDQYAPDGDTKIAQIFFLICPVCFCLVVSPEQEQIQGKPELDAPERHIDWHVEQMDFS